MSLVLLLLVALVEGAAFVGARLLAFRSVPGIRLRDGIFVTRSLWERASSGAKVGFVLGGPAACYFVAWALLFVATFAEGERIADRGGRIDVSPGLPAEAAGLRDGDVIVSVDGKTVESFDDISAAVRVAEREKVDLEISRDGEIRRVPVALQSGKIGVRQHVEITPMSPLVAAGRAFLLPLEINRMALESWTNYFFGPREERVSGPVRMVQEVSAARERSWSMAVSILGALASYFLWIPVLLSLVSIPRRRRS